MITLTSFNILATSLNVSYIPNYSDGSKTKLFSNSYLVFSSVDFLSFYFHVTHIKRFLHDKNKTMRHLNETEHNFYGLREVYDLSQETYYFSNNNFIKQIILRKLCFSCM